MNEYLKRTWAVINLDNLLFNVTKLKSKVDKNTKLMGVVKADAYGHGDHMIAKTLVEAGIDFLAVSNLDEAISLREGGITCPIIILGVTPDKMAQSIYNYNITQTVYSPVYAALLNERCKSLGITLNVHIKVDTGMNRIGFLQNDEHSAANDIRAVCALENLNATGIFTHLSSADMSDGESCEYTKTQIERFNTVLRELDEMNCKPSIAHLQNSAAIAFFPDVHYDYARAGILMYGSAPSNEEVPFEIRPVMELKSVVSMVKEIPPKSGVSYGRRFVSDKKMRVATVAIGYGDGYPRLLSNKGYMLIRGNRANIVGNVCMDQLMLDVSDIPDVCEGDVVTVVGSENGESVSFDELAQMVGTISYELMCMVSRRVPRVYVKDGETVEVVNYIKGY